jgi:predicted dehydrogenase
MIILSVKTFPYRIVLGLCWKALFSMKKHRFVAVGTGARIPMFIDPIVDLYRENNELAGLCDVSRVRSLYHQRRLSEAYGIAPVPVYADFDQMLRETRPDTVIVCTPDCFHHDYIIKALDFGADVISEKPLTIDAAKCREIFEVVRRTGRRVRTTFNYRWSPGVSKVKELILSGAIGRPRHVQFEYFLNTAHGADYFRRWHSCKAISGGLLVHKSTHHFDLINWWIDAIPSEVHAIGELVFYGRENQQIPGWAIALRFDVANGDTEVIFGATDESGTMRVLNPSVEGFETNRWYHIAVTVDRVNQNATMYLDGKILGKRSLGSLGNIGTSAPLVIGRIFNGLAPFSGSLDDFALWSRALSSDEIEEIYARGQQGRGVSSK